MKQMELFDRQETNVYPSSNSSFCRPVRLGPRPPLRSLRASNQSIHALSDFVWHSDIQYTDSIFQQEFYWPLSEPHDKLVYFWLHQNHSVTLSDITRQLKYLEYRLGIAFQSELWFELEKLGTNPDWENVPKNDLESFAFWIGDVGELIEEELIRTGLLGVET